jgi:uncharacterized protein (TIGR00299 family) protein
VYYLSFIKILVVDPQTAGVSGDMLLGALVDLGVNPKKITQAFTTLSKHIPRCKRLGLNVKETTRLGLRGIKASVLVDETTPNRTGGELINALEDFLKTAKLSQKAKDLTRNSLTSLLKAEASLHSSTVEDVHLHEAGSADTLADIVGVAVALEGLGLAEGLKVYTLPINVGMGTAKSNHGIISIPPPATIEILRKSGLPFKGGTARYELATPTGVAILANLAEPIETYPEMKAIKLGYGAGARKLDTIPNLLRISLGQSVDSSFNQEEVYILETNVDDVSGEVLGYLTDTLLKEGAKDAYITPTTGKKSRPSFKVTALASKDNIEQLIDIFFKETGTLGVRVQRCERFVLQRQLIPVEVKVAGEKFKVKVKIAKDLSGKIINVKPEFEDMKRIAIKKSSPLREVIDIVKKQAERTYSN